MSRTAGTIRAAGLSALPSVDAGLVTCGDCQLDRIALTVGPWRCYLRAAATSRFWRALRVHSGRSVWRTLHNGEGSIWPRRWAGSPHGLRDAPPAATST